MTKPPALVTLAQAARLLGVTVQRADQLARAGKLGVVKPVRIAYRDVRHVTRTAVERRIKERGV